MNTQAVSLDDNHAIRNGGAVYLSESLASGHVGLQDLNCRHNTAKRGGCIFMNNIASLGILNSRGGVNFFEGNKANAGGALYLLPSSQVSNNIMLAACEFIENKALLNYEEEQPEIDIPRLAIEDAGQEARDLHGWKDLLFPASRNNTKALGSTHARACHQEFRKTVYF